MPTFAELKSNLKKDFSPFPKVRVGLLADSATQLLAQALRGAGFEDQLDLEVFAGETSEGEIERQLLDRTSPLSAFKPDFVVVYAAVEKLLARFQKTNFADREGFAARHLESVRALVEATPARLVYLNLPERDDGVFGNFANKVRGSWISQLRQINSGLMELAQAHGNLFIDDLALLAARHGADAVSDRKIAIGTDLLFSIDFLPSIAKNTVAIIAACLGRFKKCLVLDLDDTIWGGVIGDDGMENLELGELGLGKAFGQLQAWAKQLRERGIILAVSSKNDERIAKEPFEKHPDMVLRLEDIAVFSANWENKADNLRHIRGILEIGFDSMVFIDDNPVERDLVRRELPELCVPELPEDPVEYLPFLQRLNLFETASLSEEDVQRTGRYQKESQRRELQRSFANEAEFLRSLEMRGRVEGLTAFNVPRVAQLSQRSNQFNLRTVRYSEDELRELATSPTHAGFAFSLDDRFGAHGLIGVAILEVRGEDAFIDTWLMSCRVLKRGVEWWVLNTLAVEGRLRGVRRLIGEYLPTRKNGLVEHHYAGLGFSESGGLWHLELRDFNPRPHFIREEA
jgi:FkbH-like protein